MALSRYQNAMETLEPAVNYQRASQISSPHHVAEMTSYLNQSAATTVASPDNIAANFQIGVI